MSRTRILNGDRFKAVYLPTGETHTFTTSQRRPGSNLTITRDKDGKHFDRCGGFELEATEGLDLSPDTLPREIVSGYDWENASIVRGDIGFPNPNPDPVYVKEGDILLGVNKDGTVSSYVIVRVSDTGKLGLQSSKGVDSFWLNGAVDYTRIPLCDWYRHGKHCHGAIKKHKQWINTGISRKATVTETIYTLERK